MTELPPLVIKAPTTTQVKARLQFTLYKVRKPLTRIIIVIIILTFSFFGTNSIFNWSFFRWGCFFHSLRRRGSLQTSNHLLVTFNVHSCDCPKESACKYYLFFIFTGFFFTGFFLHFFWRRRRLFLLSCLLICSLHENKILKKN